MAHLSTSLLPCQNSDLQKKRYTYTEIASRQKSQQELKVALERAEQANKAKSQFLANMSHEIRTPLNAILGYAQIMRRADLEPDHKQAVETIQSSGNHLLRLINDVLDLSKIEAGRMTLENEDFDLRQMLQGLGIMFQLQCQEKGLAWSLEGLDSGQMAVHGDEPKLRQVLINLLGNAVKFTNEGGVGLSIRRLEGDRYRFAVWDSGIGLTPEDIKSLFRPFQQGEAGQQQGGTGLGLAIAQRQVHLMGGELAVESTPGDSTLFEFAISLPPAEGEVFSEDESDEWSTVRRLAPGFSVRALVADDIHENREILRRMLSDLGCRVELAENGLEALEKIDSFKPDIVLLDIRMPVMDGMEAHKRIRQRQEWGGIKVVAISASVLEHERVECLQSGFDDFIFKPFRFEWICACFARHLAVEYEHEEGGADAAGPAAPQDWSTFHLEADIHGRLMEAAEVYSVTDIEEILTKIGEEPCNQPLAERLRELKQELDMDGIIAILKEVDHE